jgi:GntR family transcriptional repressor for pyruvate dehydrogenase complex
MSAGRTDPDGTRNNHRAPRRRQKVAMTIAQTIVSEISERGYRPGTKLPTERDMLEKYQAGRGTLRESLRFLEMNGVITVKPGPGGGPVVATPDSRDLASTLGLFLELNRASFRSVLEFREVLEPAIARQAAEFADDELVEAIGESVRRMENNLQDLRVFLDENDSFHHLIATAARNPIFGLLIDSLDHIVDGTRVGIDFPPGRRKAVLTAHEKIQKAIATHDGDAAHAAMEEHVVAFTTYVQKKYPEALDRTLRWSDIAP